MRGADLGSVGRALLEDLGLIDVTPDQNTKTAGNKPIPNSTRQPMDSGSIQ